MNETIRKTGAPLYQALATHQDCVQRFPALSHLILMTLGVSGPGVLALFTKVELR